MAKNCVRPMYHMATNHEQSVNNQLWFFKMYVQLNKLIVQRYIDLDLYFLLTNQGLDIFDGLTNPKKISKPVATPFRTGSLVRHILRSGFPGLTYKWTQRESNVTTLQ